MKKTCHIFWFRRDLRLKDNHGLFQALSQSVPVLPIFIFDKNILGKLPKNDHRVSFIYKYLNEMEAELKKVNSGLQIYYGNPMEVYEKILKEYDVKSVYANHDYEPYSIERDKSVQSLLRKNKIDFLTFKDQVIFEKYDVVKDNGRFYSVYTPYMKKWKEVYKKQKTEHFKSEDKIKNFFKKNSQMPSLKEIGFEESPMGFPGKTIKKQSLTKYKEQRDFPAMDATSHLSVHLRFGTVSVRELVKKAIEVKAFTWLNELIWREFFMQILYHNPRVINEPFRPEFAKIKWRNSEKEFDAWIEGKTGYPIVDAGMREIAATGHMHNRVRMIVGSFLIKHLLIDWRWGEKYFAEKLFDFELSSNNGNWQWVAGCGCDAAPYFRIFNPEIQKEKFDKNEEYIKRWVPEYGTDKYPEPIVDHVEARERCLRAYAVVK
jgi:deoxyribodipyrimidine photo-lyase